MLSLVIQRHQGIADEGLHQQSLRRWRDRARAPSMLETGAFHPARPQSRHARICNVISKDFELRHGILALAPAS